MKKSTFILQTIAAAFLFIVSPMNAAHLDGLWRSDRQDITLRIEQSENGIRAKRLDQGIWYNYILRDNNVYADRHGNWYEVIDDHEIMWYESGSSKRMYFTKISDRNDDRYHSEQNPNTTARLDGRWYDRTHGEYLVIKSVRDGFVVQAPNGASRKFTSDRSGSKYKDGNGNTLQVLDRNTIRMRNNNGRQDRTYVRQETNTRRIENTRERDENTRVNPGTHRGNSGKVKHDNHGQTKAKHANHGQSKKSCG